MARARDDRFRSVLVHEHVSGGGLAGSSLPPSWEAEGSAIRRALARDLAAVPGVGVVMTLDARLPLEDGPWTVARLGPGTTAESIARLAAAADLTIPVAPEPDGVLLGLALAIDRAGGRSLGPDPASIALAADKDRLGDHLRRLGIPTPEARLVDPRSRLPADFPYPAVLKPVDGAGSIDTLLVESPDDPIRSTFPGDVGLLCRFAPGEPRGATFLARPSARAVLVGVARQEMTRDGGRFAYRGGAILDEGLAPDHPARRAVAALPGLRGLVGVDTIHDPTTGAATVLEINPRPTTSVVGLVAVLGPGRLAGLWLDGGDRLDADDPRPLARPSAPLRFLADGTIL